MMVALTGVQAETLTSRQRPKLTSGRAASVSLSLATCQLNYRISSNSTSKMRVAFGGMTPPTPLVP